MSACIVQGPLSESRRELIMFTFSRFPGVANNPGVFGIDADEVIFTFDGREHPEVVNGGSKSASDVFQEFLSSFDVPGGRRLTYLDFERFYSSVSACVQDDEVGIY